jgi:hypothetical protein
MSIELTPFNNCYEPAFHARGTTVNTWGKDSTGLINYQFNMQGFRSNNDYNWIPKYAFFGNSAVFGVGVPADQTMISYFDQAHNYGLSGSYLNAHSITNLKRFIESAYYNISTKLIFVWIDRPNKENITDLINQVNEFAPGVLHISMGEKTINSINLMPSVDFDVSNTHPGPNTHRIWAQTIKLLLTNARKINNC